MSPGFLLGVVWPMPSTDPTSFEPVMLRRLRSDVGVDAIRVNVDYRIGLDAAVDRLEQVRAAGLEPWPILDLDELNPLADVPAFETFCQRLAAQVSCLGYEILNEPGGKMSPETYAIIVTAAVTGVMRWRPDARIYIAGELVDPVKGRRKDFYPRLLKALPAGIYDCVHGVALHIYREPRPATFSGFGTRRREWRILQDMVGNKPLCVTETGWRCGTGGVSPAQQAMETLRDLQTLHILGAAGAFVYSYVGHDWGLLDPDDWSLRPVAYAVAEFLRQLRTETS